MSTMMRSRVGFARRLPGGLVAGLLFYWLASPAQAACQQKVLDHDEKRLLGGTENLCTNYGGKVVLVVNTASHCGYTPQYQGLEKLYKQYQDQGLVVLGFPSNEFMQEWADDQTIQKFCQANFGVSFPMFSKSEVRGNSANPLFKDLAAATGEQPSWNFNKYLIARDGHVVAHYASTVTPESDELTKAIKAELAPAAKTVP
jgi:glutathione peroxidase